MPRIAALLLLLFVSTLAKADLSGKYEGASDGEKYTLILTQAGNDLTGDIKNDGPSMTLTGKVDGDAASGTIKISGIEVTLHFTLVKTAKGLNMKVAAPGQDGKVDWADADEFVFTLVEAAKPAEKKKESVLAKFSKQPSSVLKEGKEYVHASGGKFRYPASWSIKEVEGGLQLIPADANADEAYFVVADAAEGKTDPAAPDVVSAVDQQVLALLPFVKQVGKVEKTTAGSGPGAIVIWDGKGPTGKDIRVKAYLTIIKNYGVALVAVGTKPLLDKRDAQLREVFATFGWGQGKLDTQLVGTWNHWSYSGTNGYGRETKARVVLDGSGQFSYQSDSETSISATGKDSGGNVEWTGGMNSRRGTGWKGTWTADGSNLILHFEDGSTETFNYRWKAESNGNVFLIVEESGGGKPTEWSRGK